MLNDIILTTNKITIIKDNEQIPADDIKPELNKLLESSYFAPSYIIADEMNMQTNLKKEICIELQYNSIKEFKGNSFEKLLFVIKPKYNWLTFYRYFGGAYQGKCLNLNLSHKTNDFYKYIKKYIGEKNEK